MEKVTIFIDAGNFYHLVLKRLVLKDLDFNFEAFSEFLVNGRAIGEYGKRYYVGTVRQKQNSHESDHAMANQTKLFTNLSKSS